MLSTATASNTGTKNARTKEQNADLIPRMADVADKGGTTTFDFDTDNVDISVKPDGELTQALETKLLNNLPQLNSTFCYIA